MLTEDVFSLPPKKFHQGCEPNHSLRTYVVFDFCFFSCLEAPFPPFLFCDQYVHSPTLTTLSLLYLSLNFVSKLLNLQLICLVTPRGLFHVENLLFKLQKDITGTFFKIPFIFWSSSFFYFIYLFILVKQKYALE